MKLLFIFLVLSTPIFSQSDPFIKTIAEHIPNVGKGDPEIIMRTAVTVGDALFITIPVDKKMNPQLAKQLTDKTLKAVTDRLGPSNTNIKYIIVSAVCYQKGYVPLGEKRYHVSPFVVRSYRIGRTWVAFTSGGTLKEYQERWPVKIQNTLAKSDWLNLPMPEIKPPEKPKRILPEKLEIIN